jgi:hypothetical protein
MAKIPDVDCYDYVRRYYRVPAYVGVRVRRADGKEGALVAPRGGGDQYLHIRLDGERRVSGPYHPTDGITYLVVGSQEALAEPPAADASDPHATDPGNPSTRDVKAKGPS